MRYSFNPVGIVHSPFREKFGIPRQSGLVPEVRARLEMLPPYDRIEAFSGLEDFSHIWVTFVFHEAMRTQWQPMVRPPRLGGNRRIGVFASRSPFRPNPVGMSVVALEGVSNKEGKIELQLSGVDLLDGTPVLDIKPYVSYADSIPDARGGFAAGPPEVRMQVRFSEKVEKQLVERGDGDDLHRLIVGLLETDPRPAYTDDSQPDRVYGIRLYDFDLKWQAKGDEIEVLEMVKV